jgi:hypothetical protein
MYHFARTKKWEGDVDKWDRWILHQEEEKQREKDKQKKKGTTNKDPKETVMVSKEPEVPRMKEKEPLASPLDETASPQHQSEREIDATIDEDIRSAARELIEIWKTIRQVSEEYKQVIREVEERRWVCERVKNRSG